MRKSIAVMILALLVVSMVPMVFAQDDVRDGSRDRLRMRIDEIREDRAQLREVREGARERAIDARARFAERKEDLRMLREECVNNDSAECQELRENAKAHTKEFLLSAADRMLGVLDKLLLRVENARMDADDKSDLTARIEAKIAAVEAAREQIEALTDESTREEFKAAAQALRSAWAGAADDGENVREIVREGVGRVAVERFGGIVTQAEQLSGRLETIKARLGATDVDTSAFDEALAEAREKLDDLDAALDANDMQRATVLMQEAKESLADARRALASILQEFKAANADAAREIRRAAQEAQSNPADSTDADSETENARDADDADAADESNSTRAGA